MEWFRDKLTEAKTRRTKPMKRIYFFFTFLMWSLQKFLVANCIGAYSQASRKLIFSLLCIILAMNLYFFELKQIVTIYDNWNCFFLSHSHTKIFDAFYEFRQLKKNVTNQRKFVWNKKNRLKQKCQRNFIFTWIKLDILNEKKTNLFLHNECMKNETI